MTFSSAVANLSSLLHFSTWTDFLRVLGCPSHMRAMLMPLVLYKRLIALTVKKLLPSDWIATTENYAKCRYYYFGRLGSISDVSHILETHLMDCGPLHPSSVLTAIFILLFDIFCRHSSLRFLFLDSLTLDYSIDTGIGTINAFSNTPLTHKRTHMR